MVSNASVSARTHYAVIGDPVDHSLSPALFEWLFGEMGMAGGYSAMRVPAPALAEAVGRVRTGELAGLSVTLPHKEAIVALMDELDPLARQIGAVNCVARSSDKLVGHNTDASGFRLALEQAGVKLAGARLLLLGAGGAARAAAFCAVQGGARSLTIANRNPERAFRLSRDLITSGMAYEPIQGSVVRGCSLNVFALPAKLLSPDPGDIVVNATSVGLRGNEGDPLPAAIELSSRQVVLDMVYRPLETPLLARARASGAIAVDGLWMLVHQALEQLRLWTGAEVPSTVAPRLRDYLRGVAR